MTLIIWADQKDNKICWIVKTNKKMIKIEKIVLIIDMHKSLLFKFQR